VELVVTDVDGLTDTQSFTITVANSNDAPYFTSSPLTSATQDVLYSYSVNASDPDAGDTLAFTASIKPTWLTLTDNGDGTATLTGTPNNENVGDNQVKLNVFDLAGLIDTQTFTITVENVNDPPIANNQSIDVQYETPSAITLTGYDIDNDELTFICDLPLFGSLSGAPPNIIYTPPMGFIGVDTFTFKVNDGTLDSDIATVTINVLENETRKLFLPLILY